ncbi:MAG: ACT domain-containing protein [Ilumatobacteraceae bacterium]|nr:ACT domain-containing protein [Ilumatobacteraceae bacterium]
MAGETDLAKMLATLDVDRRPGRFAFVSGDHPELRSGAVAMIEETEGTTLVVPVASAREAGLAVEFEAAWLTLTVFSALEAVGLTAAFSAALGEVDIPCNVLAGYHHDHLLVPVDRVDDAVEALLALRSA